MSRSETSTGFGRVIEDLHIALAGGDAARRKLASLHEQILAAGAMLGVEVSDNADASVLLERIAKDCQGGIALADEIFQAAREVGADIGPGLSAGSTLDLLVEMLKIAQRQLAQPAESMPDHFLRLPGGALYPISRSSFDQFVRMPDKFSVVTNRGQTLRLRSDVTMYDIEAIIEAVAGDRKFARRPDGEAAAETAAPAETREFRTIVAAALIANISLPGVSLAECVELSDFLIAGGRRTGKLLPTFWPESDAVRRQLADLFPGISYGPRATIDEISARLLVYPESFTATAKSVQPFR